MFVKNQITGELSAVLVSITAHFPFEAHHLIAARVP